MANGAPTRITIAARGSRHSTGIMASASGATPTSQYSSRISRSHSIFSGAPLGFNTRLQSGRVSLTAEPNSAAVWRHPGTQTGIHAVAPSPNYPPRSPMMLGRTGTGGTAQSQFGIPTVRGPVTGPSMPGMIPLYYRKVLNSARVMSPRTSVSG